MNPGFARLVTGFSILALTSLSGAAFAVDPYETSPPYAHPLVPGAVLTPIVTTGQQVQLTGAPPGTLYRFLGIPDGLGGSATGPNELTLFCNHEFTQANSGAAGPLLSGARVSELKINFAPFTASIASARNAIQNVYAGEPSVLVPPGTPRFARFCSGYLGGPWSGLDQPIYFCGEETAGAATFDGQGGSAVALVAGDLYQLPRVGHAAWENVIVLPYTGSKTAVVATEDAGSLTSQIYMYVGDKQAGAADVLSRNGLNNGQLYVLAFEDAARKDEATFVIKGTTVPVRWAQVNYAQNDAGLEAQSQAVGSFNFVRVEDICYDKVLPGVLYFVTTGSPGSPNPFGRLYRLVVDPSDPAGPGGLTLLLDGSEGIVSPDNIDTNGDGEMLICEDPNYNLSLPPIGLPRDTYLWRYSLATTALTPIAELDRPTAIAHALAADALNTNVPASNTPGGWEFSGVIDASAWVGSKSWLVDVQAHSLRINPASTTVEGGQLLLLTINDVTPTLDQTGLEGNTLSEGRVELRWSTTGAERLTGYRVDRAPAALGPWTALTEELLPTTTDRFEDEPGPGDWYYRVASVAAGEEAVSHPFFARVTVAGGVSFSAPSPNPSTGSVTFELRLPSGLEGSQVDLSIFDIGGRRVATLVHGTAIPGSRNVTWDGRDPLGHEMHGLFFARLETREGVSVRRILRVE